MACRTRSGRLYGTPKAKTCLNVPKDALTKSASKRLNLLGEQLCDIERHTLTNDSVLEEIFKLSPVSPIKRTKENIKPSASNCRLLLSPLKSLSLDSPKGKKPRAYHSTFLKNRLNLPLSGSTQPSEGSYKKTPKSPPKRSLCDTSNNKENIAPGTPPRKLANVSPIKNNVQRISLSSPSPTKKAKVDEENLLQPKCNSPVKTTRSPAQCVTSIVAKCSISKNPVKPLSEITPVVKSPLKQAVKDTSLSSIKNALHNAVPSTLIGRQKEIEEISTFVTKHAEKHVGGSLYISGAPGTGKSACLMSIMSKQKIKKCVGQIISVNCMSVRSAASIYQRIAKEVGASTNQCKSARSALKYIEKHLTSSGPMILLFLDEMDQLDSKHQEVLYTMFGWSSMEDSKLILIGIANSLDLTDRILPRLQANESCKPQLINFQPYTKDQLAGILQDRICMASQKQNGTNNVIDPMAVQFCARKIAAMTGDARKALDVCRRAVEMIESTNKHGATTVDKCNTKVGVLQISKVIQGVYDSNTLSGSRGSDDQENEDSFPLQQKLVVCALYLLSKTTKCKEASLGKLHETYSTICKKRQVPAVGQSEFVCLCELAESRGILLLRKAKQVRQTKIRFSMQEKDVEFALQGKALLSSILQAGI